MMDVKSTQEKHEDSEPELEEDYDFETLETIEAKQNQIQDSKESFPRRDLEYLSTTAFFSSYNNSHKWLKVGIPKDLGLKIVQHNTKDEEFTKDEIVMIRETTKKFKAITAEHYKKLEYRKQ